MQGIVIAPGIARATGIEFKINKQLPIGAIVQIGLNFEELEGHILVNKDIFLAPNEVWWEDFSFSSPFFDGF